MLEFLYFDMGNVLLDFDHGQGCRQAAQLCGVTPNQVREVVFDSGLEWSYERGDLTSEQFYECFRREIPTAPESDRLLASLSDIFQVKPGIESLLIQLRQEGHELGILSNTCEAHWRQVYPERFPFLAERFSRHALSFEFRSMKPEAEIYRRAIALAGKPAERIFFVDDRPENVLAAQATGMDAVLFTDLPALQCDLRQRGLIGE